MTSVKREAMLGFLPHRATGIGILWTAVGLNAAIMKFLGRVRLMQRLSCLGGDTVLVAECE